MKAVAVRGRCDSPCELPVRKIKTPPGGCRKRTLLTRPQVLDALSYATDATRRCVGARELCRRILVRVTNCERKLLGVTNRYAASQLLYPPAIPARKPHNTATALQTYCPICCNMSLRVSLVSQLRLSTARSQLPACAFSRRGASSPQGKQLQDRASQGRGAGFFAWCIFANVALTKSTQ